MKKILIILFALFAGTTLILAQNFGNPLPEDDMNQIEGGLGFTWIDGQPYTTFTIAPDLS